MRACYAALRMQESVKRYAEEVVASSRGIPVRIRVGLNSGEVVVRAIGSDLHMDYTAVGQTTHLAARMEQLAEPGCTLLTARTLRLVEGFVDVVPRGRMPIKGFPEPVDVAELVGAASARSRLHVLVGGELTRFVGRAAEMDQLQRALDRAVAGRGQIVAVMGEAGAGKSRLFWEFAREQTVKATASGSVPSAHTGIRIIQARSVSYGRTASWSAVADMLREYFQVESADDAAKVRDKVTGRLLSMPSGLEATVSPLLWLLDVPADDPAWEHLEPSHCRRLALDAMKRLVLAESTIQPLVLIVEDLHWIDAESQALLDELAGGVPAARLLFVGKLPARVPARVGGRLYYTQIRLDPFPLPTAKELLASLLGTDPALDVFKESLIRRTATRSFWKRASVRSSRPPTWWVTAELTGSSGPLRRTTSHRTSRSFSRRVSTVSPRTPSTCCRLPPWSARTFHFHSLRQ